jgi:hypothetical protein
MCEIMVVSSGDAENIVTGAKKLYQRNSDGVGIVAVYRSGGEFKYQVYKAETPNWESAREFVKWHDPWRFIVHARLATCGGTGYDETHPIEITDDDVDVNYVVHNGHVQDYNLRSNLKNDGHELNTSVDSELIAHAHGSLPETLDDNDFDEPKISGQLHYLLLGDERILIRDGGKYHLSDDMEMTCRGDWAADDNFDEYTGFRLYKPDGSFDEADIRKSGYQSFARSRSGGWGTTSHNGSGRSYSGRKRTANPDQARLRDGDSEQEPEDNVSSWGVEQYENTGDEDVDELQVREYFTNHPPYYWEHMDGEFVCTVHNRAFDTDRCCDKCVDMIDPEDVKYFEREYQRSRARTNVR